MKQMYDNLVQKTIDNPMFFSSVQTTPSGIPVQIFSYHIANYSDWLTDDAIECRGIMFDITDKENPVILSRPMEKFFNLNENPLSEEQDILPYVNRIEEKRDGSLISTYLDGDKLLLKSKGSLYSDQANDSNRFLMRKENRSFKDALYELANLGYTVNMEYTSPKNQIVLAYEDQELQILNIRNNETGDYLSLDEIAQIDMETGTDIYVHIQARHVDYEECNGITPELIQNIREQVGIEGYVLVTPEKRVKLKTDWYVSLHRLKDSISNNKRLVESVIGNTTDDLRQLFNHDEQSINKIKAFEDLYTRLLGEYLVQCRNVYSRLKGKTRKEYAINAQKLVSWTPLFGVLMKQYDNYDETELVNGIVEAAKKNLDHFIPKEYK